MKFLICFVLGFLSLTPDISMALKESGSRKSEMLLSDISMALKESGSWKSEIYYDPRSDEANGPTFRISDVELLGITLNEELMDLMGLNEKILRIYAYREDIIASEEFAKAGIYHMFVVLQTKDWWWSVEKGREGITIQRSEFREYVRDHYRGKRRPHYEFLLKDSTRYKIQDLFEWLYDEDELSKEFSLMTENCQHFAKRIFFHFAADIFATAAAFF
ncbi:unnamed protein product [Cyprideis torosa]|uniref:Uncharacterized protein n=1 Tax=Cyprideis torosa TaxID=163714 RepID=A0A7R8WN37_9CRUS|nr:unnamed protein product [Cyprideis torosa]CAG0905877.1 unnamed protein product [Cyprideis torosa]